MPRSFELELFCPGCSATQTCGPQAMVDRLRSIGLLRRMAHPELDLVEELFRHSATRFACQACGNYGLVARESKDETWTVERTCEDCGQPIPAERVRVLPQATRCASCQARSDQPTRPDQPFGVHEERDFCPHCGEVLVIRQSPRSGISRYTMYCPKCRTHDA